MQEVFPGQQTAATENLSVPGVYVQFEASIARLATVVPELQARPEVAIAGRELIDEFGLEPSLFDSEDRSVVFAGIASKWADAKTESGEAAAASKTFVANATTLLAHDHSSKLGFFKGVTEAEDGHIDDATALKVYDKYTDQQLSEAVRQKIDAGILDATKQRMGITPEDEDEYEVRVLSIGDESQTYGLDAPKPDYSLPYNHPDLQAAQELQEDVRRWKDGLVQRTRDFAQELGRGGAFAPAWVTELDGKRMLCISTGLAEKIVDKDVIRNTSWYDENQLSHDLAILAHEYTHTQGGLLLDREVNFGVNLEELRAEHFAGNKQGYQDIKGLFSDYYVLTGHNIPDELDAHTKGGTATEIYSSIANRVGLSSMLELLMASPKNYIAGQSNPYVREAYDYIGGFDGVEQRIEEGEVVAGRGDEIDKRMAIMAQRVYSIVTNSSTFTVEFWQNYRKQQGLNFMTDRIATMLQAQEQAA